MSNENKDLFEEVDFLKEKVSQNLDFFNNHQVNQERKTFKGNQTNF